MHGEARVPSTTCRATSRGRPAAGIAKGRIMPTSAGKESVTSPVASTAATRQELPYRLRQQSLLGEFGRTALQTRDIGQILQRATELCAQGLETPFVKGSLPPAMRSIPAKSSFPTTF